MKYNTGYSHKYLHSLHHCKHHSQLVWLALGELVALIFGRVIHYHSCSNNFVSLCFSLVFAVPVCLAIFPQKRYVNTVEEAESCIVF